MNKIVNFLFGWLKVSNRLTHLKVGVAVFFGMLIIQIGYMLFQLDNIVDKCSYIIDSLTSFSFEALLSTVVAMLSVEYIQKKCGYTFDWLDVFAGCIVGLIIHVIMFIVFLIRI